MASRTFRRATPREVPRRRPEAPDGSERPAAKVASARAPVFAPADAGRFAPDGARRLARGLGRLGEALAYSSGLAGLVGFAMTWAVGRTLASPSALHDAALVACGAFVVYNVDRLRDLARDGASSPRRSAFVIRHRSRLVAASGLAALALAALLASTPVPGLALVLAVGAIGLLHRRLKDDVRVKIAYVAAAWTAACVGLPWLAGTEPAAGAALAPTLLVVGSAVTANLIASNLRAGKCPGAGWATGPGLALARAIAIAGILAAAVAPEAVGPLAWIPATEAAVLCAFRASERFAHLAVDGALLLGALLSTLHGVG